MLDLFIKSGCREATKESIETAHCYRFLHKIKDIVSPSQCLDIAKVSGDKFYSKEEVERKKYIFTFTLCSEHQMWEQSNYHSTQTLG